MLKWKCVENHKCAKSDWLLLGSRWNHYQRVVIRTTMLERRRGTSFTVGSHFMATLDSFFLKPTCSLVRDDQKLTAKDGSWYVWSETALTTPTIKAACIFGCNLCMCVSQREGGTIPAPLVEVVKRARMLNRNILLFSFPPPPPPLISSTGSFFSFFTPSDKKCVLPVGREW